MTSEEAQSIVVSVWTIDECIGKDYTVHLDFTPDCERNIVNIRITDVKTWKTIFEHDWQTGDTLESFLEALNVRVNSIFDLEV